MPRTIDLPFVGTPTNLTEFIVTKRQSEQGSQNTGRISWGNTVVWIADAIGLDQPLSKASSPSFRNITIQQTSTFVDVTILGRLGFNDNPQPDISSKARILVTNDKAGVFSPVNMILRFYNDNASGFDLPQPYIEGQFARGTYSQPQSVKLNDKLISIFGRGYDGVAFTSTATAQLNFYATEDYVRTSNITPNAGVGFSIETQPNRIRVDDSSVFSHIHQRWSTSAENITINELFIGDGGKGQNVSLNTANGVAQLGHGSTNVNFINSQIKLFGVPRESTAASLDNNSLDDTNRITFIAGRRNGVQGRRNAIVRFDTIGRIDFRAQGEANQTGLGFNSGQIAYKALDNYTTNTHGSSVLISTINSGTNLESERLFLSDLKHNHNSEGHFFYTSSGTQLLFSITTSSINFYTSASFVAGAPGSPLLAGRATFTTSTNLASNTTATIQFEAYKSYMLSRITSNYPVWLRVYSDSTSRSNDAGRALGASGANVSGLIYELYTTTFANNKLITPGILGFNSDANVTGTVYLSVTNKDIVTRNMVLGFTMLRLEN